MTVLLCPIFNDANNINVFCEDMKKSLSVKKTQKYDK